MFNEKEIVTRILKGDFRAFEVLVKQYEKLVFFVMNRLVHRLQDKEDICQEVFIKVHKSLSKFQFQSKLSTWIASIAYLTAVDHVKKNKADRQADYPENIDHYHFTDDNPEVELVKKDTAVYINVLIAQMPLQYRTVLTLYHLNEFTCPEIEQITGIPEGTVKSHLFRARKLLKEKIEHDLKY
ncbi:MULTISPECIES: sigma-70 family RNA polymerase sigma factor [unclassified Mucilaginibacter]|uniref:RNA polymerase sigma factor n=1 Tax=unclassified Mucilaginibacter TaxID=2617802 RepID=UPI002AC8E689|nr:MULTISPECIES: sigma-70 family RNA polymerase sigma factor [unclassified Mucilaginibacter]MEB0280814.1 sigma-70 family RNA polymerase sigma factor [Mucilaginibacter sp. 10B2]MEB0302258.1 sigma-70 family RNA polymerase sigma factor [Mucilaginibacter sp. 5C4]WPX25668.1 sigma-70 family RNA polymerase sigma factor [Mucilaginibacter sp. 5C4]